MVPLYDDKLIGIHALVCDKPRLTVAILDATDAESLALTERNKYIYSDTIGDEYLYTDTVGNEYLYTDTVGQPKPRSRFDACHQPV